MERKHFTCGGEGSHHSHLVRVDEVLVELSRVLVVHLSDDAFIQIRCIFNTMHTWLLQYLLFASVGSLQLAILIPISM